MTDRAREALFSSLGPAVAGRRVLDLYAGSGSLGLEALSRGADAAVFVESERSAVAALRRNADTVGLAADIRAEDVAQFLDRPSGPYDLAFVDPPYALSLASLGQVLKMLDRLLADAAIVVVHRRVGGPAPTVPERWALVDRRRYGDAELFRYTAGPVDEEER